MTNATMLVEKRSFEMPRYETVGGTALKNVRVGYETYGTLSPQRDNVVLVPHYLTGNSHAAGKYAESDPLPGYWDMLIGPGKAIDTNKFFVISIDSLCNANTDAFTLTTGPSSIDPDTGKPYGMGFPVVTILDFVRVQHALLASLDIFKIHTVIGVSMGSTQAFVWAANYPDQVQRVIGLTPNGVACGDYGIQWLNQFMQAIQLDPKWQGGDYYGKDAPLDGVGLMLSLVLHAARGWDWASATFARRPGAEQKNPLTQLDHKFAIEEAFDTAGRTRAALVDANNFLYLCKANQLYSLLPGSADGDYRNIRAPMLLVPVSSDLMLPPANARRFAELLKENGCPVEVRELSTEGAHLAGVVEAGAAGDWITEFMQTV